MSTNTGGSLGPRRTEILAEILSAYLSTSDDERRSIAVLAGDNRLRLLHPAFTGREVHATEDDLQALERAGYIEREIRHRYGDGSLRPTDAVIKAYIDSQRPTAPAEPPRRIGFDTPSDSQR